MATTQVNQNENDLENRISGLPSEMDEFRTEQLEQLQKLHNLSREASEKELKRLTQKYGLDHPRVHYATAQLANIREFDPLLRQEILRSQAPFPVLQTGEGSLYGRVLRENGKALSRVNVILAHIQASTQYIKIQEIRTDTKGYFALTLSKEDMEKIEGMALLLVVVNQEGEEWYRSTQRFSPTSGISEYTEIEIADVIINDFPNAGTKPLSHPKFTIFKGEEGKYYFRLTAKNGEIILQSKGYDRKSSASAAIDVLKNINTPDLFEKLTSANKQYYFNLKTPNGEILAFSETYKTLKNREDAIRRIMEIAPKSKVENE